MSQSLSKLYVHIIFHVKRHEIKIYDNIANELYAYIGSIVKDNDSIPIQINGMPDHIHILCVLSKNISLAKLVEEIKKHSSRWIKTKGLYLRKFAWQNGYAAFSVSASVHDKTVQYITNQREHHKKLSFKEEYLLFLKEYEIGYNEVYIWKE